MAYQGYSDQPGNYGQSQPYGGPSPYQQAGNPYDQNTSYNGGDPYAQGQYDRQGYEMGNMNGSGANRILEEVTRISDTVKRLDERQADLAKMQDNYIHQGPPQSEKQQGRQGQGEDQTALEREQADLMRDYRALTERVRRLKSNKESGDPRNKAQVGRINREVQKSINNLQKLDSNYTRRVRDQSERDYRLVNPDASPAEVREAIQDPNTQVFAQAIANSNRQGQAQSISKNVRQRHEEIQSIEKDMVALAAMFQDLDALVVQQEATVAAIEERGEETVVHGNKGVEELGGAVDKARAARKKKFICLGIGIAIVVVIVVVVVVVVEVVKK